jgi:hypothetical protein
MDRHGNYVFLPTLGERVVDHPDMLADFEPEVKLRRACLNVGYSGSHYLPLGLHPWRGLALA